MHRQLLSLLSLMPKVWYLIKMSGLYSSSLCVKHDEAAAMYANITPVAFVFCFRAAKSTF